MYLFYLDLLTDLFHMLVYLAFFVLICTYYGLPLHIMRDLYLTCRSFQTRVTDFIRYRRVTHNMQVRHAHADRAPTPDTHRPQAGRPATHTFEPRRLGQTAFPDATEEELDAADRICIICREPMTSAKKLRASMLPSYHPSAARPRSCARQHGQSGPLWRCPPWQRQSAPLGRAPARLLRLLRARLAALGSSAHPGRGRPTGRPPTASAARASRLPSR